MLFTDYYAEASCTAGRANFITGELPIRTGMTTVGQAGATVGLPAEAVTIATALKAMGYATGQFGKNHLGDRNEFLPTVHGFDEFFGYLYHLDAMEDPCHPNYPQDLRAQVGPAQHGPLVGDHVDDSTVDPRWGKVGKQKIEDKGELCPKRMETVDDEIRDLALKFIDKAKADNKPFFLWLNPTRMHIVTHLSPKYQAMRNSKNGWSIHEAGMAQLDDDIGLVMKKLKDMGVDDNTIVVFTTDNGTEVFTWPDGGQTPFAQSKGTVMEGGFRAPAMIRWPGKGAGGQGRERHHLRARLVPDLRRGGRQPEHRRRAQERARARWPHLQGVSRRLQPDGHDHRQGAVESPRNLLLRGKRAWSRARRRLQVSLHRPARRLAR
jgi:arylsulfatase